MIPGKRRPGGLRHERLRSELAAAEPGRHERLRNEFASVEPARHEPECHLRLLHDRPEAYRTDHPISPGTTLPSRTMSMGLPPGASSRSCESMPAWW